MKSIRYGWAISVALAYTIATPSVAQTPLSFPHYVTGLPAAASLSSSDGTVIVQEGVAKKWLPYNYFLDRDAGNALSTTRANLFPNPVNGNCIVGDGSDWVSDTCPGGSGGMDTSASNAVLPDAVNNILANRYGQTFFAADYPGVVSGVACAGWTDGVSDVGDCINAAINAAVNSNSPLGKVLIPAGSFRLSTTITQNGSTPDGKAVMVEGAGGQGGGLRCNTTLTWIGANGGTMVNYDPTPATQLWAPGLKGMCLIGAPSPYTVATGANIGLRAMSTQKLRVDDVYVSAVQAAGMFFDEKATANAGSARASITNVMVQVGGQSNSVNAHAIHVGPGNDAAFGSADFTVAEFRNIWVNYKDGDGFRIDSADANYCYNCIADPLLPATGVSLRFTAPQVGHYASRDNVFQGAFGGVAASGPVLETGTFQNTIFWLSSGAQPAPVFQGTATGTTINSNGNYFTSSATANTISGTLKTGLNLANTETINTLYRPNSTQFAAVTTAYDLNNASGSEVSYAAIRGMIQTNTAGAHEGILGLSVAAAGALSEKVHIRGNGAIEVGSGTFGKGTGPTVLVGNNTPYQALDTGGTVRGILQISNANHVDRHCGSAGCRWFDNWGATPFLTTNGSGVSSYSQAIKVDSLQAVNSGSAAHTIHNDGTNTDVNAPSGNLDLKVANAAVLRVTSAGASMQTGTITVPTPSAATDAANKAYADSIAAGVITHASAAAATAGNLTATYANGASGVGATLTNSGALAAFQVDGYSAATNDRILVKNQTAPAENGIYTVTTVGSGAVAWVLTRATDFDAAATNEVAAGASIIVVNGTTNAKTQWVETGQGPFTIGTTAIVFDQVLGGSSSGTVNSGTTNQLGYYAANGTAISGLTTANNGVLVTSAGGVPSISSTLPNATQDNLTRLGTIGVGVWNGTAIGVQYGGTGANLSATGGASQVLKQTSAGGNVTVSQVNYTDLAGTLPNPAVGTKGGVEAIAAVGSNWVNSINTSGVPQLSRPTCGDLSDAGTGCSTAVGTAAAAATGTSGHTLPYLDGANTWSGTQTFGAVMTNVNAQTGTTYTLQSSDCGKTVLITNASAITLTIPNSLAVGCHVAVVQGGAGQITVSPAAGANLRSAHSYTKTFSQYAGIGLSVMTNAGGSAAEYYLFGDGA